MRKFDFMNNLTGYFEMLGQRESSGNYRSRNPQGYLGKYQMGESAMIDAGYYNKKYNIDTF